MSAFKALDLRYPKCAVFNSSAAIFGLGRGQQINGHEPRRQWQLGRFEHGAAQRRRLVPARTTLVVQMICAPERRR